MKYKKKVWKFEIDFVEIISKTILWKFEIDFVEILENFYEDFEKQIVEISRKKNLWKKWKNVEILRKFGGKKFLQKFTKISLKI